MKTKFKAGSRRGALLGVTAFVLFLYMFFPRVFYIAAGPAAAWFIAPYINNI